MSATSDVPYWTCWSCGKEFSSRMPGVSALGKGPIHAQCLASVTDRLAEAAHGVNDLAFHVAAGQHDLDHELAKAVTNLSGVLEGGR